jgi:hypothetical protein
VRLHRQVRRPQPRRDPGRPLTSGERDLARQIFGDAIDYDAVRIHHCNFVFWQGANYIVAPNGHLYLGRKLRHLNDFSAAGVRIAALFIHEMTHVWQHQRGVNVMARGACEQVLHWLGLNQYRYRLETGKPLAAYKLEQQGDILRDYFLAQRGQASPYRVDQFLAALGGTESHIV